MVKRGTSIQHTEGQPIIHLAAHKSYLINCNITATICSHGCSKDIAVKFLVDDRIYPGMSTETMGCCKDYVTLAGTAIVQTGNHQKKLALVNCTNERVNFADVNITVLEF